MSCFNPRMLYLFQSQISVLGSFYLIFLQTIRFCITLGEYRKLFGSMKYSVSLTVEKRLTGPIPLAILTSLFPTIISLWLPMMSLKHFLSLQVWIFRAQSMFYLGRDCFPSLKISAPVRTILTTVFQAESFLASNALRLSIFWSFFHSLLLG